MSLFAAPCLLAAFLGQIPAALALGQTTPTASKPVPVEGQGDALPPGAVARLGAARPRQAGPAKPTRPPLVQALSFSPDGRLLAGAAPDRFRLWEPATGQELLAVSSRGAGRSLAFSPDGKRLAVAASNGPTALWDVATGKQAHFVADHLVCSVAFAPGGRVLATGLETGFIYLREPGKSGVRGTLIPKPTSVRFSWPTLAMAADDRTLAAGYERSDGRGAVHVWDMARGEETWQVAVGRSAVRAVAFAPDARTLASAHGDGVVRLWDVATGRELQRLAGAGTAAGAVAFSPDGKTLAAAAGLDVIVWDPTTGKEIGRLKGHPEDVTCLAFAPDGRLLASGAGDGGVLLWDPAALRGGSVARAAKDLSRAELGRLWADLAGDDVAAGWRAVRRLAAAPDEAAALFRERMPELLGEERQQRVGRWVAQLDDDDFRTRQAASAGLRRLGAVAEPALRKVLESKPSLEARKRAEDLLSDVAPVGEKPEPIELVTGHRLRLIRVIQILERTDSRESRALLEELTAGLWLGREAREAQAAVNRLTRRSAGNR